jgi:hypothetical protein
MARPERKVGLGALILLIAVVALVGVASAAASHNACFHPPPPVTRPDPGTPRGEYCGVLTPLHPWLTLTISPCLLVAALWLATGRRRAPVVTLTLGLCVGLVANAIVVNNLTSALTI